MICHVQPLEGRYVHNQSLDLSLKGEERKCSTMAKLKIFIPDCEYQIQEGSNERIRL